MDSKTERSNAAADASDDDDVRGPDDRAESVSSRAEPTHDEIRWRAVLKAARDAIVSIDSNSKIIVFNPAAQAMFGYTEEEVLGRDVSVLMPQPYAAEHAGYIERWRETGEARAIGRIRSVRARASDGRIFPIELSVTETTYSGGQTFTAIIRDVSETRELEAQIKSERDYARHLVEIARILVLVLDGTGRVLRVNPHLADTIGVPASELVGCDWLAHFVEPPDRARFGELLGHGLDGLEDGVTKLSLPTRRDESRVVEWRATTQSTADEAFESFLLVGHDVTDRERDQRALAAYRRLVADREKRADFAAVFAQLVHDFGNPLAGLSAQAQLVQGLARRGGAEKLDVIADSAGLILREARRLEARMRELMTFSRRQQRLVARRIDARAFAENVAQLWRGVASSQDIELRVSVDDELESFEGDEEKLRRVVENLIKNAIEAIEPNSGRIDLRLERDDELVRIEVTDDGPGIPETAEVFRLFETSKASGSGLGLAVSRQLVQLHRGKIWHERPDGGGTTFVVTLPSARPEGTPPPSGST